MEPSRITELHEAIQKIFEIPLKHAKFDEETIMLKYVRNAILTEVSNVRHELELEPYDDPGYK